jgi:hypothetical protein
LSQGKYFGALSSYDGKKRTDVRPFAILTQQLELFSGSCTANSPPERGGWLALPRLSIIPARAVMTAE